MFGFLQSPKYSEMRKRKGSRDASVKLFGVCSEYGSYLLWEASHIDHNMLDSSLYNSLHSIICVGIYTLQNFKTCFPLHSILETD
jgi:hypothetical protein